MSQQGLQQAAIRAVTGTALDYNGDWSALFDLASIPAGGWSGRLLAWINLKLGTDYADVAGAMAAFATANGAVNFGSVGTFSPALSLASETTALLARFTTQPNAARRTLINTLIAALKSGGVWSKLDALYVTAAHDAQAAQRNWVADRYNLTPVAAPTFTADRGYAGNGSSSYLDTGFNPATASSPKYVRDSAFIAAWNRTERAGADISLMGSRTSTASYVNIIPRSAGGNFVARTNSGTNALSVTMALAAGHFISNRSASNALQGYKNGVSVTTSAAVSTAVPNVAMALLARSLEGGAPDTFTTDQILSASIGSSLSAGEALALYNALDAYRSGVGA